MEKAQVLKNIGSIGRASAKLTKDIQATAVGCVEHAVKHGDVTLADQLVDALGKGLRKASLRAWFEKNAPMFIAKGKDKFSFDPTRKGEWNQDREDTLLATPWEEAKPEEKDCLNLRRIRVIRQVHEACRVNVQRRTGHTSQPRDDRLPCTRKCYIPRCHRKQGTYRYASRLRSGRNLKPANVWALDYHLEVI